MSINSEITSDKKRICHYCEQNHFCDNSSILCNICSCNHLTSVCPNICPCENEETHSFLDHHCKKCGEIGDYYSHRIFCGKN